MRIKIEVTEENIKKGARDIPWCCALALAIKNVPGLEGCLDGVASNHIYFYPPGETHTHENRYGVPMTEKMKKFVRDFDTMRKVKPQTFYLTGVVASEVEPS